MPRPCWVLVSSLDSPVLLRRRLPRGHAWQCLRAEGVVRTPSRARGGVTSSACCLRDLGGLSSADTGSHVLCARACREGGSRPAEPRQPVRRGRGPTAALLGRAQSRDPGQRKRQDRGVQRPGTPSPTTQPRGGSRGTGLVGTFGGSTRDGAVWSGLRWEDPDPSGVTFAP